MPRPTRLPPLTATTLALTLALTALPDGPARTAEPLTAEQIIQKTDATMTRARDQSFEYDLITYEPGKDPRVLKFEVIILGDKKRRIEFLAPGDVRGMRFLVLDVDQMYVYLPAYKKVRRVASHVKSQGFMGSTYTQDLMSLTKFGETFTGKLLGEDETHWILELIKRPEKVWSYPKLHVKIRKDMFQPAVLEYYNDKGAKLRTETREGFRCEQGLCNPRKMTLLDHTRGDMKSEMIQRAWKPNTGVAESEFTVRALQRKR